MDLVKFLTQFNLNKKEAAIYLAALSLPKISINELTKTSGCSKRSTVIFWLKRLKEKGLIKETREKNKRMFVAMEPDVFLQINRRAIEKLARVIPRLRALKKYQVEEQPAIRLYNDIAGLKSVFEELLKDRPKEFRSIANNNLFIDLDNQYFKTYRQKRFKAGIKARFLLVNNRWGQEVIKVQKKFNVEARLLPKEYNFESEIMCWRNKVATMYYSKPMFIVVVIESQAIAKIHHNIFEMLWRWSVMD